MHSLRISSLFLLLLTVLLTGCSYKSSASAGTGTVNIKYDRATGICEISLSYRGNNYNHSFIVDETGDTQREQLQILALNKEQLNLNLDHDAYMIIGGCIASPMEWARKPIIHEAIISYILPSPSLTVKNKKQINGPTPEELASRGFTVHFNRSPQFARTSLPKLIDANSIYFSANYLEARSAYSIAGIRLRSGLFCISSTIKILEGTLEVPPVDQQHKGKNKGNVNSALLADGFLEKWEFNGVVSGYSC